MTTHACPACGEEIELDITWREDSDGDGIWTRTWYYPDLATEARCLACGAEPDADTLAGWLDKISETGPPEPSDDWDWASQPDTIPF